MANMCVWKKYYYNIILHVQIIVHLCYFDPIYMKIVVYFSSDIPVLWIASEVEGKMAAPHSSLF